MSSVASMSSSNPVLRGISYETYCRVRDETDAVGDRTRLWFDQGWLEIRGCVPDGDIRPSAELHGISYATYCRVRDETDAVRDRTRLNFVRGRLEVVSPSHRHESWTRIVHDMITVMAMELGIPVKPGGATTLRRSDLHRGVEPDECYWVQSEPAVRAKDELCFDVDPPPDLVFEAEVSRSLQDRLETLAALGVPEVWRFEGTALLVSVLREGRYERSTASRAFPWLPLGAFQDFLLKRDRSTDHTAWLRAFAQWVRDESPRWDGPGSAGP